MTFRDPKVLEALAAIEVCKLDIDLAENRDVSARLHRLVGVPAFVALSEDGRVLHRWQGALPAADLLAELATAARAAAVPPPDADPVTLAEFACARGDVKALDEQLAVLVRRAGPGDGEQVERLRWLACTTACDQQRWAVLAPAAQSYLDRCPDGDHRVEASVLLGRATFAVDGVVTEPLRAHVEALLADIAGPFPDLSLADRARDLAGTLDPATKTKQRDAAAAWARRANAGMKELALIGPPAVPALRRQLLEGEDRAMQHAATVIGWMRLPANEAFLREQLANAMPPARRRELVRSLAMHKEPSCLPLFVAIAGGSELPAVRTEAVNGIRQLGILGVGCADRAVAEALDAAVASKNEALRQEALQAMLSMQAPLALAPLLAVLGDRRPMFDEFRLCDNALWVIERQLGMHVEIDGKTESKCTPEAAAFLEQWFAANGNRLEWDAKVAHWVPTR